MRDRLESGRIVTTLIGVELPVTVVTEDTRVNLKIRPEEARNCVDPWIFSAVRRKRRIAAYTRRKRRIAAYTRRKRRIAEYTMRSQRTH